MLFLLCQTSAGRFLIPGQRILEVLPMVAVSPLAGMAQGMVGVMRCRGASVPVLDLTELTTGAPAPCRMTTRVVLLNRNPESATEQLFGVIAERATRTIALQPDQFSEAMSDSGTFPFLGPLAWDAGVAVRRVEVDRLADLLAHWVGSNEVCQRVAA